MEKTNNSSITLLRPKQWTKNGFVFLPLFFAGLMFDVGALLSCAVAFVAFSLAASSIYCLNDIMDADADKQHPEKYKRPIATGAISKNVAYAIMVILLLCSMSVLFFFSGDAKYTLMTLISLYYVMTAAYCIKLKHYAIIDVMIIAVGFVLRVWVGGVAANIAPSEWIIIMTFLLALFLAFAKRRDDVVLYETTGVAHRQNTNRYNLEFMNQVITVIATVTIVAYIMWALSPGTFERFHNRNMYFTAIFVLMGIIRYLQISIVDLKSGAPEKVLLRDRFVQFCIAGWIVMFMVIIYI